MKTAFFIFLLSFSFIFAKEPPGGPAAAFRRSAAELQSSIDAETATRASLEKKLKSLRSTLSEAADGTAADIAGLREDFRKSDEYISALRYETDAEFGRMNSSFIAEYKRKYGTTCLYDVDFTFVKTKEQADADYSSRLRRGKDRILEEMIGKYPKIKKGERLSFTNRFGHGYSGTVESVSADRIMLKSSGRKLMLFRTDIPDDISARLFQDGYDRFIAQKAEEAYREFAAGRGVVDDYIDAGLLPSILLGVRDGGWEDGAEIRSAFVERIDRRIFQGRFEEYLSGRGYVKYGGKFVSSNYMALLDEIRAYERRAAESAAKAEALSGKLERLKEQEEKRLRQEELAAAARELEASLKEIQAAREREAKANDEKSSRLSGKFLVNRSKYEPAVRSFIDSYIHDAAKGKYLGSYWEGFEGSHLYSVDDSSYDIKDIDVVYSDADGRYIPAGGKTGISVTVLLNSSTKGGMPIRKLWNFILVTEDLEEFRIRDIQDPNR